MTVHVPAPQPTTDTKHYYREVSSEPKNEKRSPAGVQTLARGLRALNIAAMSVDGVSIVELADALDVHRTIAYRVLSTLCEAGLLSRGKDGRYRGATGLAQLAEHGYGAVRAAALPILQTLADRLRTPVTFFVREENMAVALAVAEASGQGFRMSFAQGNRTTLDQGAAAHAIRALDPPRKDDAGAVRTARELGYSISFGEVEPNLYGLAVPVPRASERMIACCINLVSNRREVVDASIDAVVAAAAAIAHELATRDI